MTSRRFLGELDAADDLQLEQHFVSPEELDILLRPDSHIIFGAKGVGKTALRRALTELKRDRFLAHGTIDLDNLSFQRVHSELEKIGKASGSDPGSLARVTWKNVLAFYCLDTATRCPILPKEMVNEIRELLADQRFTAPEASNRLLNLLLRTGRLLYDDDGHDTLNTTIERRIAIESFPSTPEVGALLARVCTCVAQSNRKIAICVDGFDSIVDHAPESRKAVFAGLIDAIFRLSRDASISTAFCFKAFLPKELTHEAKTVVWDVDKHLDKLRTIHWTEDSLREFIAKRLMQQLKLSKREASFDAVWNEFMPSKIRNNAHDEEELSFSYVLRHTQFRPRQLLYHLQCILDAWDQKSTSFRVDASFVPKIVAQSSRQLAQATVHQLEFSRAGIEGFLRSWGGSSSTVSFSECFSKIKRLFAVEDGVEVRQIFDELFEFGVLGVVRRETQERRSKTLPVRFAFVGDGVLTRLQPQEDDIVVLCPMFSEYFACTKSAHGIVTPVSV